MNSRGVSDILFLEMKINNFVHSLAMFDSLVKESRVLITKMNRLQLCFLT